MTTTMQRGEAQFAHVTTHNNIVTVVPLGPSLGERESIIISDEARDAIKPLGKSLNALVLDMRKIDYMASVGISMCVELHNLAKASKAKVIVVGLSQTLEQLFQMLKLTRVFTFVTDDVALEKELSRLK